MSRTSLIAPLGLCLALIVPQGALAAGGPVGPVQGGYIHVPGSPYRYAAFNAGGNTVVKQQVGAGPAVSALRLPGHYGIPGADYSGSTTGLSADGHTLIVAEIPVNGPPRTTRLLVLNTAPLAVRARLALPGFSTVDAVSPDGRWLYLIHYSSLNISRYEVLAYDLPARRLLAQPVVDPRDRGEAMTGVPVNRVMSAGGRWAYTLYLRPSGVPFVHALDTTGRRAVCIDLPMVSNVEIGNAQLALSSGGTTLQVSTAGETRAVIDTRTFTVSAGRGHPATASVRPVAHRRRGTGGQSHVSWELIVLLISALGVVAATGAAVARSRRHPDYRRGTQVPPATDLDRQHTDRTTAEQKVPLA
jgi:hypothetical protein